MWFIIYVYLAASLTMLTFCLIVGKDKVDFIEALLISIFWPISVVGVAIVHLVDFILIAIKNKY